MNTRIHHNNSDPCSQCSGGRVSIRTKTKGQKQVLDTFAQILSAVAALGALAAAIWAARVSKRLYEIETSRDRGRAQREEKAQASGIAAWCVFIKENQPGSQQGLLLHNSSDAPVFDVEVLSTYATKQSSEPIPQAPLKLAVLPPGDYVSNADATYKWSFPEERGSIDNAVRPVTKNPGWVVTEVRFTDSYGTPWTRIRGNLEKRSAGVN